MEENRTVTDRVQTTHHKPMGRILVASVAMLLLVAGHFVVWSCAHHRVAHDAILAVTTTRANSSVIPRTPVVVHDRSVAHWSMRPTPVLGESVRLTTLTDLLSVPLVIPSTHSGTVEWNGVGQDIPAVPVAMLVAVAMLVLLWDRYLRPPTPDPIGFERVMVPLIVTLTILLPLPGAIATFVRFYILASGSIAPVTSTPTLVITSSLLLAIYPLVFLHLRWKRAAKFATKSSDSSHCPKCNYERGTFDTCPECGTPRTAPTTKLSKAKRHALIAGYAAIPLLLIAPFWLSWIDIAIYHITH